MRNLKKALSLALALVMLLGMMVVGAGAAVTTSADFSDKASIAENRKEAVDVMTALEVFQGDDDKKLNPEETLTREQAAAIVARMLLGSAADNLKATSSSYSDVATDRWSAGVIEYCTNVDILAGHAGKFDPTGELTNAAFAKMMLGALGYEAEAEGFTGANWAANVRSVARRAGIDEDLVVNNEPMTREDAAQMAFNTMKADVVDYSYRGESGYGRIETITNRLSEDYRVLSGTGNEVGANRRADTLLQFCEMHFKDLKYSVQTADAFGDLISRWYLVEGNKNTNVSSQPVDEVLSYTAAVTNATIYSDLGLDREVEGVTLYVDGAKTNTNYKVTNSSAVIAGNGAETKVWTNEYGEPTRITVKNYYLGDVTAVNAAGDTATIMKRNTAANVGVSGTLKTSDLAKGDVVLYTMAGQTSKTIQSAEKVEPTTGVLNSYTTPTQSYNRNGKATVDGTEYSYSAYLVNQANVSSLKKNVSIFLDKYGYIIDVIGAANVPNYAYVIGMGDDPYTGNPNKGARLLLATGEIVNVSVGNNKGIEDAAGATTNAAVAGDIVSYSVNARGEYDLVRLADGSNTGTTIDLLNTANAKITTRGSDAVITSHRNASAVSSASTALSGNGTIRATGDTIFMVNTTSGYKIYKGIANVPSINLVGTLSGAGVQALAYCSNVVGSGTNAVGYAAVVYVDANSADVETRGVGTDVVFILGLSNDIYSDADRAGGGDTTGSYYQYRAIVNGQITTILARDKWLTNELFTDVSYDDQGIARLVSEEDEYQGVTRVSNDVLTLNTAGTSAYVTMNSNPLVFQVQGSTILQSDRASVHTDSNDKVWYDAVNGYANLIIVEKVAGGDGSTTLPPAGGTIGGANVLINSGDFANKAAILATLGSSQTWRFTGTITDWASWGSSTGVKAEDCVFMTFTTKTQTTATLKIMKNNEVVYMEPLAGLTSTTLYMSWVDVASDVVHHAASATGSLANPGPTFDSTKTAWPSGNYTWEVTASDGTLGSGSFTITH